MDGTRHPADGGRSRSLVPDPRQNLGREPSKPVSLGTCSQCHETVSRPSLAWSQRSTRSCCSPLWRKFNGWSQPSQFSTSRTLSPDVSVSKVKLSQLQAEPTPTPRCAPAPEVGDLQRQITELVRERDQLRQGVSKNLHGDWFSDVPDCLRCPPCPFRVLRICKDGCATGIASGVDREVRQHVEPGFRLACHMATIRWTGSRGHPRSVQMINAADTKRRCLEASSMLVPSRVVNEV